MAGAKTPSSARSDRLQLQPPHAVDGSPVRMRLLDPARDVPAVCALFAEVFGHPLTEEHWRWKYTQAPGASHYHAVAEHEGSGQMLGYMGVAMVPGVRAGQAIRMGQACDLMISPQARSGIGPDSVYRHVMHTIRSAAHTPQVSPPGAAPLFIYGFPGQRPATLAMRLGIQRRLQICAQYATAPQPSAGLLAAWWRRHNPRRWQLQAQPASVQAWSDAVLDPIWADAAHRLQAQAQQAPDAARPAIVKNGAYLRWRYLQHPLQQAALAQDGTPPYTLWLLARGKQAPAGWLVTRPMPSGPTVVDSCLPPDLVATALQALPATPEGTPWCSWLPHAGAQAQDTPIWATAMCGGQFFDHWPGPALQPGDTDVF